MQKNNNKFIGSISANTFENLDLRMPILITAMICFFNKNFFSRETAAKDEKQPYEP